MQEQYMEMVKTSYSIYLNRHFCRTLSRNIVPMIHVKDLCSITSTIVFKNIKPGIFFIVDDSITTQKTLIRTISQNVGNGKYISIPVQQNLSHPKKDILDIDLYPKRTDLLEENYKVEIQWHCKGGIIQNIVEIISQFNYYRGLRPNRVFINGPPVSGKSFISTMQMLIISISQHYNLPIIRVAELIQTAKQLEGQFGDWVRKVWEETKEKIVQQQLKIFEELKKKKKPKKGEPVQEFNPNNVQIRLSDQHLCKIYQWRLGLPDCSNKGYILDSYPKTLSQAKLLFTRKVKKQIQKKSGQQQKNQTEQIEVEDNIDEFLPNSVIQIQMKQQDLKERLKGLVENPRYKQQVFNRRNANYKKSQETPPMAFFSTIPIDKTVINGQLPSQQLKSKVIQFIQRVHLYNQNGPIGFTADSEVEQQKQQIKQQKQEIQEIKEEEKKVQSQINLGNLKAEQIRFLNQKSKPIRQYLIDNVVPRLTQGLIQLCKQNPADPLEYLINYLQKRSSQITYGY